MAERRGWSGAWTGALLGLLVVWAGAFVASPAAAQELAAECEYAPNGPSQLSVGVVDCLRFDSAMMGGKEPFSYYIPPACDPALGRECPVYYFLHGLSGNYQVGLGPKGTTSGGWIDALSKGPVVDPRTVADPWVHQTDTWVPRPTLDIILVAPHGPTLPGGHAPDPSQEKDTGWQDFHPQYFEGGESQVFDGPPPRAASMIIDELLPYVDQHFPVIAERSGRALGGISYGGIGTGHIGLRWPDRFSSLQMTSGIGLAWPPACAADPGGNEVAVPISAQPLSDLPDPAVQPLVESMINPPLIFITQNGDGLSTDYAYTRQHHPPDLMTNARAFANAQQVIRLAFTANDSLPYRPEDVPLSPVTSGLEHLVATETGQLADQETTLRGVPHTFEFNPGTHSNPYWEPYFRHWLEEIYAAVQHWDGAGNVFPEPDVFDYRSVFTDFSVWGWQFSIDRPIDEFINMTDIGCQGMTLRGTGLVTVTVPPHCGTGLAGSNVVTIDLGPSTPVNEPVALGLCDSYGNTEVVALETLPDLDGDGIGDVADNCPLVANADQADNGGIATSEPDGIGDACQCGDVSGNGIVNGQDANAIKRHGLGITPNALFVVPGNCDVTGSGQCNGQDANAVKRAGLGFEDPLSIAPAGQNCQNADPQAPPCTNCGS